MFFRRVAIFWLVAIVILVGLFEVISCKLVEKGVEVSRVVRDTEFLRWRRISAGTNAEEMNVMPA